MVLVSAPRRGMRTIVRSNPDGRQHTVIDVPAAPTLALSRAFTTYGNGAPTGRRGLRALWP